MVRLFAAMLAAIPLFASVPADWVPVRWKTTEPKTLVLLAGTPVNCLLVPWTPDKAADLNRFASAASAKGIATLAVLKPGDDPAAAAKTEIKGIVLEGDFPDNAAAGVKNLPIVQLTSRAHMNLTGSAPIVGTYQGVWPGVRAGENVHAGPSAAAWIDTNAGFLRFARAFGNRTVWIANLPPPATVVTTERYMQVIGDAAMVGARWAVALDDDFSAKLYREDPAAVAKWQRIAGMLQYFEDHKDWRDLRPGGKLVLVQDVKEGALLSGGILDMIATKHTPVHAVPPRTLNAGVLKGSSMAVNVDNDALTPAERDVLITFRKAGGTVLTGPPDWKAAAPEDPNRITLDEKELTHIDDMWHDMQAMIGRKNLGVRLFNVSTMLSNLLTTEDGKQVVVQLVNYSDYPVENVTVHVLGKWSKATLFTIDGKPKAVEVYETDEGTAVDLETVGVVAAVRLE